MSYAATIIIPLLRQVDIWLDECVRSALHQTVPTEVVVVKSEMTPQSNVAVLERLQRRYPELKIVGESKPGSFPNAINTGFEFANADRVGLLLSDDWLEEDTIAACIGKAADIVSTGNIAHFPDGRANEAAGAMPSLTYYRALRTLEEKAAYLQHFFLFRKEIALRIGLDETIGNAPGIDDYDFIWTLLEHNATVEIVAARLYHYRDHDGERLTLGDPQVAMENLQRILRKHQVSESDLKKIIKRHMLWYGRPLYRVLGHHR